MCRTSCVVTPSCRSFVGCVVLAALLGAAVPAFGQPQGGPPPDARPETPGTDRAALRTELSVARMLARLDEELDLGTFPDASPLWGARLAASIEARGDDEPAQQLLRRLAVELRSLGVEWPLGGPPDERPDGRPLAASPAGRERAERIARIRDLVELVNRKLGLAGLFDEAGADPAAQAHASASETSTSKPSRIATKYGSDSCAVAPPLFLGYTDGSTYGTSNDGGASCGGPTPSPDVWYVFTAPQDGSYTFQTIEDSFYSAFDTVLSLHAGCPLPGGDNQELACSDDTGATLFSSISYPLSAGEPVWVRVSGYDGASGPYTLRVTLDRTIRGTVTRDDTGTPISGATVEILDTYDQVVSATTSGADGTYAAGVVASSELYVRARDTRFVTELYDNHPCPFGSYCSTYLADAVSVSSGDAAGIDFALDPAGSISGSITAADTGEPPPDWKHVDVYDSTGAFVGSESFYGASGDFELSSLAPGSYYLQVEAYGYQTEVWQDLPCSYPCDPTSGTPIVLAEGSEVSGIDFVLDRLGKVRGVVTRTSPAAPVASERVEVYDDSGDWVGSDYTASDGSYEVYGLPRGQYFVRTDTASYFDELYDDLPCEPDCVVTTGVPVNVPLNVPVSGIDFALVAKASIEGNVTDADTADPLEVSVYLYDTSGSYLSSYSTYSPRGYYRFDGLAAGTYFLRAGSSYQSYYLTHEGELYDDLPCEPDCDVTTGTPVVTTTTSQVTGIDFELNRRGSIGGTVTDAATGLPISSTIQVYRLDGTYATQDYSATDGSYEVVNLPAGSYRVGTASDLYRDEMYDDVPCGSACDTTMGAVVTVQSKLETAGIDFALDRLGSISGSVRSAASGALLGSYAYLLDTAGGTVAWTDAYSGFFELEAVNPGTYYLVAREDSYSGTYQDEVYPDVPCQPDCDVTEGLPIVVGLGSVLTGYDFRLAPCPVDSRKDVTAVTLSTSYKALACDRVSASGVVLAPGADVTFKSGRSIVLGDGFRVEEGASFRAVIEPAWNGH